MNLSSKVKKCTIRMLKNFKQDGYLSQNYKYESEEPIGEGGFGKVYKVRELSTNKLFAMKEIQIKYTESYSDESISQSSEQEDIHSSKSTTKTIAISDQENILEFVQCCQEAVLQSEVFKHPNIVAVHDKWIQKSEEQLDEPRQYADYILTIVEFLQSGGQEKGVNVLEITPEVREALINTEGLCVYLTMDLYDTDLKRWLARDECASNRREEIIKQLTGALTYIHSRKGYCHLDLTPSNIMIKEDERGIKAAIADFGLSQLYKKSAILQTSETRPGKFPYNMAPDTHLTDKYDMWSFGLIVYEIINTGETTVTEVWELSKVAGGNSKVHKGFFSKNTDSERENQNILIPKGYPLQCSALPLCDLRKRQLQPSNSKKRSHDDDIRYSDSDTDSIGSLTNDPWTLISKTKNRALSEFIIKHLKCTNWPGFIPMALDCLKCTKKRLKACELSAKYFDSALTETSSSDEQISYLPKTSSIESGIGRQTETSRNEDYSSRSDKDYRVSHDKTWLTSSDGEPESHCYTRTRKDIRSLKSLRISSNPDIPRLDRIEALQAHRVSNIQSTSEIEQAVIPLPTNSLKVQPDDGSTSSGLSLSLSFELPYNDPQRVRNLSLVSLRSLGNLKTESSLDESSYSTTSRERMVPADQSNSLTSNEEIIIPLAQTVSEPLDTQSTSPNAKKKSKPRKSFKRKCAIL